MLGTVIPNASAGKKRAQANTSFPFIRPPAPSASASRAAKIPLLQAETMRNNIKPKHLFLEANYYCVCSSTTSVPVRALCSATFPCHIYLLVLISSLLSEEDCQDPKSCLLQVLLSLRNRVWGFPHMAQACMLIEIYLRNTTCIKFCI